VPGFILEWNRRRKKNKVRKQLEAKRASGKVWSTARLLQSLQNAGVDYGKDLLVHSAMSKIGYIEGGPAAVVDALLEAIGPQAHLLMPSSPVVTLQAEHELSTFEVESTPSKMGAITEYFRSSVADARSAHPLEPVAVKGPEAQWYVRGHHTDGTSYGPSSPWQKHLERGGQLLYIGTTLINSGTSLHAIEDLIGWKNFSFEVYLPQSKTYNVQLAGGRNVSVVSKVHNPATSALRKCDGLISLLEEQGALKHVTIGEAPSLLVDGEKFKSVLLEAYHKNGVTMYTPEGKS
jgi:aminoglycoside 3-N-acetyltransferase